MRRTQMVFRGILAAVFAMAFTACPGPNDQRQDIPATGSVVGNVVFAEGLDDGIKLTIKLKANGELVDYHDIVNEQVPGGVQFEFASVPYGTYCLYALLLGELNRMRGVTVRAGEVYTLTGDIIINVGCNCGTIPPACDCTQGEDGACGCGTIPDACGCLFGDVPGCNCDELDGSCDGGCAPNLVTGISLSQASPLSLLVGDTHLLHATVSPENVANQMVVWTSSNPAVVSVTTSMVPRFGISGPDSAVRVEALSLGTAIITATAMSSGSVEHSASLTVTVTVPIPPPFEGIWAFATDAHFQGLTIGETDLEVIFGDDDTSLPLGARPLEGEGEFEIEAIASPIAGQAISLLITAYLPLGECWGAGIALLVDEIVDGGFQAGDVITVIGEVFEIGEGVTCWWCNDCQGATHAAPGGAVTLATTGFYQEPWDNPLNVDPIVLASRNSVGSINFSVELTQAHINNINQAVAPPRPSDGRALVVGMEVLGQNQIRIDNIIFQRADP